MDLLSSQNLSLYTVPIAWWVAMVPHVYAFIRYDSLIKAPTKDKSVQAGSGKEWHFDTANPRSLLHKIESNPHPSLTREVKGQLARAEAASQNGFEGLGFFAAAVAASQVSLIVVHANEGQIYSDEIWYLNSLSLGYLASRCVYNIAYTMGVIGYVRALPFYGGLFFASTLYVRAGNALRVLVK